MPERLTTQLRCWLILFALACLPALALAQANYEIQVYGADTVPADNLMVELHSNFTAEGRTDTIDRVYPTNHQEHETLELTEGINSWSEVGFYVFTSEQDGHGVQWVGDHIRPRIRVPESWDWPVGVSLSTEVGYQRAVYSDDTWTWEIRAIIDKAVGRWYFAVNPALERTLLGALKQAKAISGDPFSDPDVESFFAALVELAERDQAPLAAFVASWELWQSAAQQWCSGPRRLGAHHGRGIQAHIAKHQNHRQ